MGYRPPKRATKPTRPRSEIVARGGLQRLNRRCRVRSGSVQCEQGPKRRQIHGSAPTYPLGTRARDPGRGPAIAADHLRGRGRTPRVLHFATAPSELERPGSALPGGGRIPVERFPHGAGRFEQAGPFASTRLLRALDATAAIRLASCNWPARARASASTWEMMSSVAGLFLACCRYPSEFASRYRSGRRRNTVSEPKCRIPDHAPTRD